ncbi:hypothetical protein J2T60_002182 [Natronospira proteinivora]|uniref:DUF4919 domain-containing protein n=1 Tax=Natronospira proteinivora TaxID=1807133 RepID=A0ABT1GE10_9GAMM|nr:DUF4919 domain-containing protein [Natronospira proteinivora]MCP1728182.1 hypothetical protein [Natronospira proteinivora]
MTMPNSQSAQPGHRGLIPWLLAALLLTACATPGPEVEEAAVDREQAAWVPDPAAAEGYIERVEQAQQDHEAVDYAELRTLFVKTSFYQPYAGAEQQFSDTMFQALDAGRYGDALRLAGRILEENYVSLDAHYVARAVYAQRGDQRRRERHDHVLRALFSAIRESGDGESRASAFSVISTRELQSFVSLFGLELLDSDLEADELGTHDRVVVRDPDNDQEYELWFDISSQWQRGFDGF